MNAGDSDRPLVEKLGIKPGFRIALLNTPDGYFSRLGVLPPGVTVANALEEPCELIHVFTSTRGELLELLPRLLLALRDRGALWVSWPKQASGVPTDVNENVVREIALLNGLVDVKVVAVDAVWSGLKLVRRAKGTGERRVEDSP